MADEDRRSLFQQKALNKLQSPDELDKLYSVTDPKGWVGLATVLFLILSGMVWAVFGVMADKVSGTGLMVDAAGVVNVAPSTNGRLLELKHKVGDSVRKGQIIATVEQYGTEQELARLKADLNNTTSRADMAGKVAQLNALTDKLLRNGQITSPAHGIVTEIKASPGDVVAAGTPLLSLRLSPEQEEIQVLLYVPALDGKKVLPGMTVQITTGTSDFNEYGSLIGRVSRVSEYPVSAEGMNRWTGSKETTNWILQRTGGSAVEVHVDLIKDPDTVSGYLWSSISGAPGRLSPGTACTGNVVVKRQAPIAKAFQKLNHWLRSD